MGVGSWVLFTTGSVFGARAPKEGVAPADAQNCIIYAIFVWGTPKGTQPHHMANYGPRGGEI